MKSICKAFALFLWCILLNTSLHSQSIDLELISNVGDHFMNPSMGELEASVGEVITDTYDPCVLTNGFHQTYETEDCGFETTSTRIISSQSFDLYPNPAFAELNINTPEPNNFELSVISTSGKIVFTQVYTATDKMNIDVSALQSGVYFLELVASDIVYTKSFIKIKQQ